MRRGTSIGAPEIPVKLNDDEIQERALSMSTKVLHMKHLRQKKSEDAKSTQALIDDELDEIQRMAETIVHCEEGRKQGELFVGQSETVDALHAVAAKACSCEHDGEPEARDPGCPVHGEKVEELVVAHEAVDGDGGDGDEA